MILLPCPCCGSTITSRKITKCTQDMYSPRFTVMDKEYVVCEMCGCSAPKQAWQNRKTKQTL